MSLEFLSIGTIAHNRPTLVFLHEGLGSVSAWRDFPEQLCDLCQLPGLIYSRTGYGQSPPFDGPLNEQFMHGAAQELACVLNQHNIGQLILIGHSDGASIALIYAAMPGIEVTPLGVIAMAPHLFVEPICTESIQQLRDNYALNDRFRAGLQRHHRNADRTFNTWAQVWLSIPFGHWNIEDEVARITSPILAIQGRQDQYGTLRQVERLTALAAQVSCHVLDDCKHSPHVDQTETVLALIGDFVTTVTSR